MNNNKNARYGDASEAFAKTYSRQPECDEKSPEYAELFQKKENFGAYVGDPMLNLPEGIPDASGKKLSQFIFENVFDEDFAALYPSIIRAFNLDKNSQVGKFFLIDNATKQKLIDEYGYDGLFSVSKNEEGSENGDISTNDLGPTLVDSIVSHDWNAIGKKFFDLPGTEDLAIKLRELQNKKE